MEKNRVKKSQRIRTSQSSDTSSKNVFLLKRTILGLVLLLPIAGFGGYYLGSQRGGEDTLRSDNTSLIEYETPAPRQISIIDDSTWQSYINDVKGYQFKFASNHVLAFMPTSEGSDRYGIFKNREDRDQCLAKLPKSFISECYKAYYFVVISSDKGTPSNLVNIENYSDVMGREWILSSIEAEGMYRIDGFLLQDDTWYRVGIEAPLVNKKYPTFLKEASEIAKLTFSSFGM